MGDDQLQASLVSTVAMLAEQQKQFAEFQMSFLNQFTVPSQQSAAVSAATVSASHLNAFKFTAFDETAETFTDFVDRLESFFQLQSVKPENQAGCLVTALSPKLFKLLKNLLYPDTYATKSFAQLRDLLKDHLNPTPLVIPSRHALFTRRQADDESVTEYLTELQQLAIHCKYNAEVLSIVLRDIFVSGLKSKTILDRLFQEDDPSLTEVVRIAQSIERAEGATSEVLQSQPTQVPAVTEPATVNLVKSVPDAAKRMSWSRNVKRTPVASKTGTGTSPAPPLTPSNESTDVCYGCGEKGHRRPACTKTDLVCGFCNREGHVEAVCQKKRRQQRNSVKQLTEDRATNDDFPYDEFALYQITENTHHDDKIFVRVWVNRRPVTFELDSGSKRTVVNADTFAQLRNTSSLQPPSLKLLDYSGNSVAILGETEVSISDYKKHVSRQSLLVVENRSNVLGRDWMTALGWLTNNSLHFDRIDVQSRSAHVHTVAVDHLPQRLQEMMSTNQEIFATPTGRAANRIATLELKPDARPVFRKARPVPMALRRAIETEITKLVDEGIWEPVDTADWATPIVPVVKPVGLRLCGDYSCTLNPQLKVAQHPFPGFDEVFASLIGGKKFSKLDVRAAFLHLPVDAESAKMLTLNTHMGLFKPSRLMYGVSSAPALWQKFVDSLFAKVPCCVVHDDIIVTGATDAEHLDRLEQIFQICKENNLRLNADKCRFFQDEVEFLGFKISAKGIHKTDAKIQAVLQMPQPSTVTEVKSFLGLVTFYARFLPNLATLAEPLYALTQKDKPFTWTPAHDTSFAKIKQEVASDRILMGYDPELPLVVAVDASPVGLGAVLSHRLPNGEERPLAFASRTLNATERRYS